ncbi:unnamed protein product [Arctogadus glacialis]
MAMDGSEVSGRADGGGHAAGGGRRPPGADLGQIQPDAPGHRGTPSWPTKRPRGRSTTCSGPPPSPTVIAICYNNCLEILRV